jgi:hypothetical protein
MRLKYFPGVIACGFAPGVAARADEPVGPF